MCLIAFALNVVPQYPLVLVSHRDEFRARRTQAAHLWQDAPQIVAGRDLEQGGTWLGVSKAGRFAMLTNYRRPAMDSKQPARSRGFLVSDFLQGELSPEAYLQQIAEADADFAGYNLLVGVFSAKKGVELWYHSNRQAGVVCVADGYHALSNALLDTPWWKAERARTRLEAQLATHAGAFSPADYIALLHDETRAPEALLPQTGISPEWEVALSSMFINLPTYGTRSATFLAMDAQGGCLFSEKQYDTDAAATFQW